MEKNRQGSGRKKNNVVRMPDRNYQENDESIEERSRKSKEGKRNTGWKAAALFLMTIAAALVVGIFVLRVVGKNRLENASEYAKPQLSDVYQNSPLTEQEELAWQEGWVKSGNTVYEYNENILTFLLMGIDKDDEVVQAAEIADGGQADALFLAVLNTESKTLDIIGINRNTMTDIDIYDEKGEYLTTVNAQIAVQHGFGDGKELSCEYQQKTVQELFYHIPVHGYCAMNMDAVIKLVDLVGGVELTAIEDVFSAIQDESLGDEVIRKGERALLDGRAAYSYVRYRDFDALGAADMRLERQKQFIEIYLQKIKEEIRGNLMLPVHLYSAASSQMVTNVTADEVVYLASIAGDYSFDAGRVHSLEGETVQGAEFEEFYPDEDALFQLILEIFYKPVKGYENVSGVEPKGTEETARDGQIDFEKLQKENPDIFAWIYVPGTNIDFPILQSGIMDGYYLEHDRSGTESKEGALYTEMANLMNMCDFNTIIHGKDLEADDLFYELHQFEEPEFFEKHHSFYIYLPDNVLTYEIVAAYYDDESDILRRYDYTTYEGCSRYLEDMYLARDMGRKIREGWEDLTPYHFLVTLDGSIKEDGTQYVVTGALVKDEAGKIDRIILD